MKVKRRSYFKKSKESKRWLENWVTKLELENDRIYSKIEVSTSLGTTQVYGLNLDSNTKETLVIFPGARTSALFWDMNRNLDILMKDVKIYLVETNGLPNLSDGNTPDIHSLDYGMWATEVLDQLRIDKAFVAGASFGGLICMKLCIVSPSKVRSAFLLNPGCLQPFSLKFKNLYYNLLPIIVPSRKHVLAFLNKAIFYKPYHFVTSPYEQLIIEYELFALTKFTDRTQKPYYMKDELKNIHTGTYLLLGNKDILFPYKQSMANASEKLSELKDVNIIANTGHGIETSREAIKAIKNILASELQNENTTSCSVC